MHWPFCEAKCPYCDFNSHVSKSIDQDRWRHAFLAEIDRYADEFGDRTVQSVFFGGGTPSLMSPDTVAAILDRIARRWPLAHNVEVTLEANPSSVEASRFAAYRTAGVNRVSLGVQALNDVDLKRLGRLHDVATARAALDVAQRCFDRASFDLIYARQNQSAAEWESELRQALDLGFSHMSLYQLTIEDGTAFGDRFRHGKLRGLPGDDLAADLYELTLDLCEDAGIPFYEVSNFAQPGEESRHNLIYWRYGDYLGLGPGAHGRISGPNGRRWATETPLVPDTWLCAAEKGEGQETRTLLERRDQCIEMIMMGARLRDGLPMTRVREMADGALPDAQIRFLTDSGILELTEDKIIINKQYFSVLNTVISQIVPD